MNRIVNSRKESRDSDKFIVKTNDDVNEWMDEFYVDGRNAPFNLHCLWAWQEQERRYSAIITELESLKDQLECADEQVVFLEKQVKNLMRESLSLKKDAARYRWLRDESIDPGSVIDKKIGCSYVGGYPIWEYRAGKELDDSIDTAMIEVNNK